jgi:hypothetical protein
MGTKENKKKPLMGLAQQPRDLKVGLPLSTTLSIMGGIYSSKGCTNLNLKSPINSIAKVSNKKGKENALQLT